jgi:lysophospholipase L1-like esterase
MLGLYKVALGPLLLLQARGIRKTALRLPEAAGPRAGTAGASTGTPCLRVLVVGDSSAAGVGIDRQENALAAQAAALLAQRTGAPVAWQLVAKSGINTSEALDLVASSELGAADVLVTALGVNDVTSQRSPRQFVADYGALVDHVIRRAGVKAVIVTGVPPMHVLPAAPQPLRWYLGEYAKRLDSGLQSWIRTKDRFAYISLRWAAKPEDMARDGYHPGASQHRQWAQLVAENCAKLLMPPVPGGAVQESRMRDLPGSIHPIRPGK